MDGLHYCRISLCCCDNEHSMQFGVNRQEGG